MNSLSEFLPFQLPQVQVQEKLQHQVEYLHILQVHDTLLLCYSLFDKQNTTCVPIRNCFNSEKIGVLSNYSVNRVYILILAFYYKPQTPVWNIGTWRKASKPVKNFDMNTYSIRSLIIFFRSLIIFLISIVINCRETIYQNHHLISKFLFP